MGSYSLSLAEMSPLRVRPDIPYGTPDQLLYAPYIEAQARVPAWARPVAPEGSFNLQFSPDGRYLTYWAGHAGSTRLSLYSVALAGGEPHLLFTGAAGAGPSNPIFTPDSSRVLYFPSSQGGGLYNATITGTDEITLTTYGVVQGTASVAVSPNNRWVAYWSDHGKDGDALYSVPAQGGVSILLGERLGVGNFQITPDGRYVLFVAAKEVGVSAPDALYRVPIKGGATLELSRGAPLSAGTRFLVTPDSQTVIFGNLYRVSIDGGDPQQLNHAAQADLPEFPFEVFPQLTPDGRRLVFLGGRYELWASIAL